MLLRSAAVGLATVTFAATAWGVSMRDGHLAYTPAPDRTPQGCCAYYPYEGSLTFVRIHTASPYDGYGRWGGWSHDYPAADLNMSTILRELTDIRTRELRMGGNVLTFDDPRLMQFGAQIDF